MTRSPTKPRGARTRAVRALGDPRLGAALLLAVALYAAAGAFPLAILPLVSPDDLPTPDATLRALPWLDMNEPDYYRAPLFIGLLSLLVLSTGAALVSRLAWRWSNAPILAAHAGVIILAVGAAEFAALRWEGHALLTTSPIGGPGPAEFAVRARGEPVLRLTTDDGRAYTVGIPPGTLPVHRDAGAPWSDGPGLDARLTVPEALAGRVASITVTGFAGDSTLGPGGEPVRVPDAPPDPLRAGGLDGSLLRVRIDPAGPDAEPTERWIPFERFAVAGGERELVDEVAASFTAAERSLPGFGVRLAAARVELFDWAEAPRDIVAELELVDPETGAVRPAEVTLNHPARARARPFAGAPEGPIPRAARAVARLVHPADLHVALAAYDRAGAADGPGGPTFVVVQIARRPGLRLVAIGVLVMLAGVAASAIGRRRTHDPPARRAAEEPEHDPFASRDHPALAYLAFLISPLAFAAMIAFGPVALTDWIGPEPEDAVVEPLADVAVHDGVRAHELGVWAEDRIEAVSGAAVLEWRSTAESTATVLRWALAPGAAASEAIVSVPESVGDLVRSSGGAVVREGLSERATPADLERALSTLAAAPPMDRDLLADAARAAASLGAWSGLRRDLRLVPPPAGEDGSAWLSPWSADPARLASAAEDPRLGEVASALALALRARDERAAARASADLAARLDTLTAARVSRDRLRLERWTERLPIDLFVALLAIGVAVDLGAKLLRSGGRPARGYAERSAAVRLAVAFAALASLLTARGIVAGRLPIQNQHESLLAAAILALAVALAASVTATRARGPRRRGRAALVAAAGALLAGLASLVAWLGMAPGSAIGPEAGILATSNVLLWHVLITLAAYAAVGVAAVAGAIDLARRALRRGGPASGDLVAVQVIAQRGALALLGVGIALGAWWADHAWGRWWAFDPKETWSLVAWLVLLAGLHAPAARASPRARPLLVGLTSLLAAAAVLWTWFGVNLLMNTIHGYA